jgi:hypothetical protein
MGGPTAQIARMHRIIVDEKMGLDDTRHLNALRLLGLKEWARCRLFELPGAFVVGAPKPLAASLLHDS